MTIGRPALRRLGYDDGTVHKLLRAALFVFATLLMSPLRYDRVSDFPDIDASWMYAMNLAANQGRKYGIDLFWTSGPLAYLFHPLDIGPHFAWSLPFQAMAGAAVIGVIGWLFFSAKLSLPRLTAFSLCLAAASPWFHFNGQGVENVLLACMLILASFLLVQTPFRWPVFLLLPLLAAFILMIKATAAAMAIGALAGLHVGLFLARRPQASTSCMVSIAVLPVLSFLGYWLTTGTTSLWGFVRGVVEISANYSVAMSLPGPSTEVACGLAVLGALVVIFITSARRRDAASILPLPFLTPLFVSWKHGFVRQNYLLRDYHTINFFCFVLLMLGVSVIFTQRRLLSSLVPLWIAATFALCITSVALRMGTELLSEASGRANVKRLRLAIQRPPSVAGEHAIRSVDSLAPPIDAQQLQKAAARPITIVSPDFVSPPLDRLRLIPLPVVQGYQACTPFLDRQNADWLDRSGPEGLLIEWRDIDGRHPIGNPATFLSIFRWYETDLAGPSSLLLRRRAQPRFRAMNLFQSASQGARSELGVPDAQSPIFMTVHFTLSPLGNAAKIFYRVPEVDLNLMNSENRTYRYRIVPELMISPILISALPNSVEEAAALFAGQLRSPPRVVRVWFSGDGLDYYGKTVRVDFGSTGQLPPF